MDDYYKQMGADDANLAVEHSIRAHCNDVRKRIEAVLEQNGDNYPSITIEYDAADGGKWRIYAYHKRIGTDLKGAELHLLADAWINTFRQQHNIAVLRSMIADGTGNADLG
jgi:hypothetical protein